MILFYKIVVNILFLAALPILPFLYVFSKKRRASLGPRLGFKTGLSPERKNQKRLWVHALSVGEVISAVPFVNALKDHDTDTDIVFTASTKTGVDMACKLLFKENARQVDQVGYFPFDLGYAVERISRQINPDAIVLVETDLWPNFLYRMKKRNVPVILINARLSSRSLKGYLFFKKFSALFFSGLSRVMVQTKLDKQRFECVGIDASRISVMGNIKFDRAPAAMDEHKMAELKTLFGIQENDRVWIAGSTHEGEERMLVDIFVAAKKKNPSLKLILAPRDPNRSGPLLRQIRSQDCEPVLLSRFKPGKPHPDLIIIDGLGLLSTAYAICDIAFVGGSMVPLGGHNPLEPAMFAKPVLFGPHMTDFLQVAQVLVDVKGACRVETAIEMATRLEEILNNRALAEQMGHAGYEFFAGNTGAVARIINTMEDLDLV